MTTRRSPSLGERLGAATAGCADVATLARRVFDTVAADVPFVFACLATTDPASGLITGAFKSHPLPIGDEEFVAAEYGGPDVNQFADLARRAVPVGVLSIDTDGHTERCRRFRDYMVPQFGFTDELRLVCQAQQTTWGVLALYRGVGDPPFTQREARLLAVVHPGIADGVRRTLFADPPAAPQPGRVPVVLILDAHDRVTDATATANELIEDLGGRDHGELPASVLAVAASARVSTQPTRARVPTRSGGWLTVQALTLQGPAAERSVVLTIDSSPPAAVGQLALAARGLTAREQEVVGLVLQGASTKVIAATLHLSPHTVQDHLKAVFDKLGVGSRRELIAQFVLS